MNAKELAQALASRAADVAAYLLPGGKKAGAEFKAGSVGGWWRHIAFRAPIGP